MDVIEIASIPFVDTASKEEGAAIVRRTATSVGLALTLREDGDIEVFLALEQAKLLAGALQCAIQQIEASGTEQSENSKCANGDIVNGANGMAQMGTQMGT